jgi:hypothetical protein
LFQYPSRLARWRSPMLEVLPDGANGGLRSRAHPILGEHGTKASGLAIQTHYAGNYSGGVPHAASLAVCCSFCRGLAAAGCTMPYRPRVVVHGSAPFPGVAGLIEQDTSKQVDVLLVHGMCTHTRADAKTAIDKLLAVLDSNMLPEPAKATGLPPEIDGIEIESLRISAIVDAEIRLIVDGVSA